MSRYIEYDAIDYRNDKMHDKSSDFIDGVIYMAQRIEEAPSIDLVFCGECKHTYGNPPIADGRAWCKKHGAFMYYCSDGERKTEPRKCAVCKKIYPECDDCQWNQEEREGD